MNVKLDVQELLAIIGELYVKGIVNAKEITRLSEELRSSQGAGTDPEPEGSKGN